jgi:hypothetical protein
MVSRLLLVFGAAAALLIGVTAPARAGPGNTGLRHSCALVGASCAGVQGVTCADVWTSSGYHPWAGGDPATAVRGGEPAGPGSGPPRWRRAGRPG